MNQSVEHHWWPVGLQRYWEDENGYVTWLDPKGELHQKKRKKRKVGYLKHGHTFLRGTAFESNFEDEFSSADNSVHRVVKQLIAFPVQEEVPSSVAAHRTFGRSKWSEEIRAGGAVSHITEDLLRDTTLLILSLLIRSPGSRALLEGYARLAGQPPNEDVGKLNMSSRFKLAKKACEWKVAPSFCFALIRSEQQRFIVGDGYYDQLSASAMGGSLRGTALVPLTPSLCVYMFSPWSYTSDENCIAFEAEADLIDAINRISQIYSGGVLYFAGGAPEITDDFRRGEFLEIAQTSIPFLEAIEGTLASPRPLFSPFF